MATFTVDLKNADQTQILYKAAVLDYGSTLTTQPVPLNQVSPVGTITSGSLPDMGAWVSGTAKVNPVSRDISVYVECLTDGTNNAATCAIAISADNSTYSTVGTVAIPAGVNNLGAVGVVVPVRLPNGWYLKLTFTATRMTVAASKYA